MKSSKEMAMTFKFSSIVATAMDEKEAKEFAEIEKVLRQGIIVDGEISENMSLKERMDFYNTMGVSIAMIKDGSIIGSKAYGKTSSLPKAPFCTEKTLFQAGSISKSVTAIAALRLVHLGLLSLDEDVNKYLKSWKIPDNEFTKNEKVTLRRLLVHEAGINVHGFPGYPIGSIIPSTTDVLRGKSGVKTVNTDKIEVVKIPGSEFEYSGGGTTIIQLMIEDLTGQTFDKWMLENIFLPFDMTSSTFTQPLSHQESPLSALGHSQDGTPVEGGWHIYPEMAAAGLWANSDDLAKFTAEFLSLLNGEKPDFISPELMRESIIPSSATASLGKETCGLGVFLKNATDERLIFMHDGKDEGFIARFVSYPKTKSGFVIMINNDGAFGLLEEITNRISDVLHIPGFEPTIRTQIPFDIELYKEFEGSYFDESEPEDSFSLSVQHDGLFMIHPAIGKMKLYLGENELFFMKEVGISIRLSSSPELSLTIIDDGKETPYKRMDILKPKLG